MNTNQYLTPEFIIREVSEMVRDNEFNHSLSRGWYMTQLYNIITELDFDSYANLKTVDFPMPTNFLLPYPKDAFNIREIYAWNGSCCDVAYAKRLYWKTEYNNLPNGTGFTAGVMNNWWGGSYPYIVPAVVGNGNCYYPYCEFFFNISQGFIMLSPNCAGFSNLRLVYNYISTPFGENPCIPVFFKEVVKTWLAEKFCKVLLIDEKKYAAAYEMYHAELYEPRTGLYWQALDRIKMLSTVQRNSQQITLQGSGNY